MPPHPPETVQTRLLIAQSRLLLEIAKAQCSELECEMVRADNLVRIAREIRKPRVQELLLDMPLDGSWMPGSGAYADTITAMLDEGSLVIEEADMPEDGDAPWRVRLTKEAIKILA
ncbi:hypothetical protein [Acidisphaera sp. L21]|uniref:hypothetical protein n=1 Tax=Acidisphaera sp. L21 TaxID=1641851 RepID=UPI00131DC2D9|nr:hypothetical protein [Acidisphaera sp. L21]